MHIIDSVAKDMHIIDSVAKELDETVEIEGLESFVYDHLTGDDEFLRTKIRKLVQGYYDIRNSGNISFKLHALLNVNDVCRTLEVSPLSTLFSLKMRLEYYNSSNLPITSLTITRNKHELTLWETSLTDCGILDGDTLVAGYVDANLSGEKRIRASGLTADSSFQYLAMALHAFMLDEGFQSVVEIKNAKDGFRPICKEIHSAVFLRTNWNADPCSIQFVYKHTVRPDMFMLSCEDMMGTIFISLSVRARAVNHTMELPVCTFVQEHMDSSGILHYSLRRDKDLHWQLLGLILSEVPHFHVRGHLTTTEGVRIADIRKAVAYRAKHASLNRVHTASTVIVPHDPAAVLRRNTTGPLYTSLHHESWNCPDLTFVGSSEAHSIPPDTSSCEANRATEVSEERVEPKEASSESTGGWRTNYARAACVLARPPTPNKHLPYRWRPPLPPAGLPLMRSKDQKVEWYPSRASPQEDSCVVDNA